MAQLFHVLANSGEHVQTGGNLMLERTTGNNRSLDQAQCEPALIVSLDAGLTRQMDR